METKICSRCKKTKSIDDFAKSKTKTLQAYCRRCNTDYKRDWIKSNREEVKWNQIWTKYRLRQDDYEMLLERQDGRCVICSTIMTKPYVDHDHLTGRVRGLLCQQCNTLVGWIECNLHLLEDIRLYLAN